MRTPRIMKVWEEDKLRRGGQESHTNGGSG